MVAVGTDEAKALDVVEAFLGGLERLDAEAVLAVTHPDIVYTNVGLPSIRGIERFTKAMRFMEKRFTAFRAINHNIASDGRVVLTERTDIITLGRFTMRIWVCGTFEVRDGKVILWRDYFDNLNVTKAMVKGAIGMVLPRR